MSKQSTRVFSQVLGKSSSISTGPTVTSSGQVVWSVRDMLSSDSRRSAASVFKQGPGKVTGGLKK